jgi:soluble lytic murein transglycosylase-like protein
MDVSTLKMNTAQLNPLYVTLATNKEKAFAYSRSSVGAMGIVQFMPKTYAAVAKWNGYGLKSSFDEGMGNATNAITAEVAYLDYLMSCLPKETVALYGTKPTLVHEVVAAAYNGGATRAVKAMAAWEENTDPKQRLHVKTRSRLKLETMNYVLKLRQVMDALFPPTQVS